VATFILVPGAGGQTWYWSGLAQALAARGHSAIAVALPAADETAGLDRYAEIVASAGEGERDPILVAQSMGGFVAPVAAARVPFRMIVFLNAMIPKAGETAGEWWANTGQAAARAARAEEEGRTIDGEFDPVAEFFHDLSPDALGEALAHGPAEQAARPFADAVPPLPPVPVRVVTGRDDRFFPAPFQARVAHERLGVEADVIPGGHMAMLSRPEELADLLAAYAAELP
jgi:pimeloyl-ACP methyl ester carboxylesterase